MHLSDLSPRYVRTDEAAFFLGLSPRTLEKHRTYGTGPIYRKLGGRVVYALEDLKAWADLGTARSTSDPNSQTVRPAKRRAGEARRLA
ncbi:helix-turn-helix domain-containing protein [Bradyrhizobium sp. 162]|uniref:helix-turn-helix transcriptional regulator n=1 Tax=Bradyrhizobium sp. 162 TaxID=2782635 RepID=UPI001FFA55AA|nr:helix-turn-helix domain-containing protein [Bradyrhizobium sp. 162]